MLDFSKVEAGRLGLEHAPFPPATAVRAVTDLMRARGQKLAGKPLKIIALTANVSTHVRDACLAADMDDFLAKPVRFELFAHVLQRNLPFTVGTG